MQLLDLQDTYFSIHRKSKKYVFRVHLPLFQVGSSTANFYKTSKNMDILNAKSANPSCNTPR